MNTLDKEYQSVLTELDDINDTNKVVKLISDAKKMDIKIMPPDINTSSADFVINEDKVIQYGLAAIKNVGYKVAELIANERKKNGPYKSIFDLCTINSNLINKKAIESLIKSFDYSYKSEKVS